MTLENLQNDQGYAVVVAKRRKKKNPCMLKIYMLEYY